MKKQWFSNKFRIVTDDFNGYEVQIKRFWFPFWFECWQTGIVNSFTSVEKAEQWVNNKRPKAIKESKSKVVKIL